MTILLQIALAATLLAGTAHLGPAHRGRATTFGPTRLDPQHKNDTLACSYRVEGKYRSVDPDEMVVALPPKKEWPRCGALVLIDCPRTKMKTIARVMDRGPGSAMRGEEPHAIDVTEAVRKALGLNGSEDVIWREIRERYTPSR